MAAKETSGEYEDRRELQGVHEAGLGGLWSKPDSDRKNKLITKRVAHSAAVYPPPSVQEARSSDTTQKQDCGAWEDSDRDREKDPISGRNGGKREAQFTGKMTETPPCTINRRCRD